MIRMIIFLIAHNKFVALFLREFAYYHALVDPPRGFMSTVATFVMRRDTGKYSPNISMSPVTYFIFPQLITLLFFQIHIMRISWEITTWSRFETDPNRKFNFIALNKSYLPLLDG